MVWVVLIKTIVSVVLLVEGVIDDIVVDMVLVNWVEVLWVV